MTDGRRFTTRTVRPTYRGGMDANQPPRLRLSDLPLWRLLVALDDAERTAGPGSSTARALARAIQERLQQRRGEERQEGKREDKPCRD